MAEKQYGLIIPSKNKTAKVPSPRRKNIFDDDSDDSDVPDWTRKSKTSSKTKAPNSLQQRQAAVVINKALKDDPTVYQYDEVYDEMEKKKVESLNVAKASHKSRYIGSLLEAAEKRKLENERRVERQVQKEREQEGDEFKDKDAFVTNAYKKKLEETQKLLEEEQRKDLIDEMTDVTKQKDLSGFYRHLYKASVSKEIKVENKEDSPSVKEDPESSVQEDKPQPSERTSQRNQSYRGRSRSVDSTDFRRKSRSPDSNQARRRSKSSDSREMRRRSRSHDSNHVRHKSRSRSRDSNVGRRRSRSKDRHRSRSRERSRSRDRHRRRYHKEKHRTLRHKHRRSRSKSRDRDRHKQRRHDSHRDRSRDRRNDDRSSKKSHRERDRHREDSRKNRDYDSDSRRGKGTLTRKSEKSPSPHISKSSEEESKLPTIWDKRTVGPAYDDAVERYLKRKALNSIKPTVVAAI